MHVPDYYLQRYYLDDGKITREVTAYYTPQRGELAHEHLYVEVYKEDEDGNCWSRNIAPCLWYGYAVAFPGLPRVETVGSYYYDMRPAWVEDWRPSNKKGIAIGSDNYGWDYVDFVCEKYPQFRYLAQKRTQNCYRDLMSTLVMWKKHPELELILVAGYERCGMDGRFWRMSEADRKKICLFMRRHPECRSMDFTEVKMCALSSNSDLAAEYILNVPSYRRGLITIDDFAYVKKQNVVGPDSAPLGVMQKVTLFHDMLKLLINSHHSERDPYWRHPRDMQATHDRLRQEAEARQLAEELAAKKAKLANNRKRKNHLKKIMGSWGTLPAEVDGYSIFVSTDYGTWNRQAKALHQCIVSAGYLEQMADGRCVICFIQKDGKPEATAQVLPDGSVNQFYADELDRNNCLPSDEIRSAFSKWLDAAKQAGVCPANMPSKEAIGA